MSTVPPSLQGSRPATPEGTRAFITTPFHRLARTHASSAMADAMVAATLASSIFFSLPADDARVPVVRYLIITMLPFALLSPLIGPLIDRLKGGHRFVLIGTAVARVVLCYLMIGLIAAGGAPFFLVALCVLVSQRAYHVARSALVPTVVGTDNELVEANSKLAMISGLAGFAGVIPAAILLKLFGPGPALVLAMGTYTLAVVMGLRIPSARVASARADATERHELRGAGIIMAGSAMGLLRLCVGFLTLLIAFDFRGGDRRPWEFGVVAAASVVSGLAGAAVAPRLKVMTSEENILTGALALVVAGGFVALVVGEVLGAAVLGSCIGFAAATGKLAFDSILQRDAPDANRGRAFAKFETRFQVLYVVGAFIPVAVVMGAKTGFLIIFAVGVFALASYIVSRLAASHRTGTRQTAATAAAVGIEDRFSEVSGEVKGRLAAAPRTVITKLRTKKDRDETELDLGVEASSGSPDGVVTEPFDQELAVGSPVAWDPTQAVPPPDDPPTADEFPWESGGDDPTTAGNYLDDLDETVAEPFPWAGPAGPRTQF